MKKVLVLLVAIVAFGYAETVYAQKGDTTRATKVVGKATPFKFTGVVKSVDSGAKTIVVTTPRKGDVTFRMDTAKFEGAYTMADNVKVGDQVSGEGTTVDGQNWVKQLTRTGAPEK